MNTITRILVPVAAAVSIGLASPTFAASPHFVSGSAAPSGNGVSVSFKEAGLGSRTTVTIQAEADYTAVFQCINGGGKNPSAANKTSVHGSAVESGSFTSDKNGQVTGSLTLPAPTVDDNDFSCPSGQKETLTQLSWSDVTLTDQTSGATQMVTAGFTFGQVL